MAGIRIGVEGDDGVLEGASLYRWLSRDPGVTATARLERRPAGAEPGEMGVVELILVLGEGSAYVEALASAVKIWHDTRRAKPVLRIERGDEVFTIENVTVDDIRRILGDDREDGGTRGDGE